MPPFFRIGILLISVSIWLQGANYTFSDSSQFDELFSIACASLHPAAAWSTAPGYDTAPGRINMAAHPDHPLYLSTRTPIPYSSYTIFFDFLGKEYSQQYPSSLLLFLHPQGDSPDIPLLSLVKNASDSGAIFSIDGGGTSNDILINGSDWYRISLTIIRNTETACAIESELYNLNSGQSIALAKGQANLPNGDTVFSIRLDNLGGGALALDNFSITPKLTPTQLNGSQLLIYALAENYRLNEDGSLSCEGDLSYLPNTRITEDGIFEFSYTPRQKELLYTVQYSTDLLNWENLESSSVPDDKGQVTVKSPLPATTTPKQFIRLKITIQ